MKLTFVTSFYKNKNDVRKIYNFFRNCEYYEFETNYLFINDNYEDEVWDEIKNICFNDKKIKGICFNKNYGQLAAIEAGINQISNGSIVYHDSDKIIDTNFIKEAINYINQGYEIIWGKPKIKNNLSRVIFRIIYKIITGNTYHYRSVFVINEQTIFKTKKLFLNGKKIIGENLTKLNLRKKFLDIDIDHDYKKSRYNFIKKISLGLNHFVEHLEKIFLNIIFISLVLAMISIISISILAISKIFFGLTFLPGWLSTVLLIIFFNSLIIFLMSLFSFFNYSLFKSINPENYKIVERINYEDK